MTDDKIPAIEKLDVDNYATWAPKMEFLLITKGLSAPLNRKPETLSSPLDERATLVDEKARSLIGLNVKDFHHRPGPPDGQGRLGRPEEGVRG
jgi:hypothetical protein